MCGDLSREEDLRQRYGEILTTEEIAEILRYPSSAAVIKAHSRGALPVPLAKLPGRRGWFGNARCVAACLDVLDNTLEGKAMKSK